MKTALIIEDDEILISHYSKMLQRLGIDVPKIKTARNGREALQQIEANGALVLPPDIILLDLEMPLMNGFDFLEAFSKVADLKKVKVIIISSTIDPNELDRAAKFGVYQYVTKPLREEVLKSMLR